MYLKKLELVGFKSFLNKTTLHFEPGIAAVVGPNGCGKSNIFDSIRWVLGEQSAKSLRGSEMQDVIFNGTDAKEPLSMAEVTLTFDNSNKFFNVDHPEVAITRRIFRSGESEYLLNKSLVRLKDILDILLGTGIGAESYSIVAQGKIDLVLSYRPEDRRLVFDEAAGITKYKSQKRETMRKLEETEQNLLRVNDIVVEVKRQIGSLERQANKARKYKEVFEELKDKEVLSASLQKAELLRQKDEIIKELQQLEDDEAKLLGLIKEQESRISNRQQELKIFEDKIMALKDELLGLDNLVIRNKERITFNRDRIKELESSHEYLGSQICQTKKRLAVDEEKLNKLKAEYAQLGENIAAKSTILKEKEGELSNLALSLKVSLEAINQAKKDILGLVANIANVKNEVADLSARQQIHQARKNRLELEKAKVNEELTIAGDSLQSVTRELEALDKTIENLNLKISGIRGELIKEEESLSSINSSIANLERENLTLASHREFIEKLKTKYDDIGEAMNAVIYLDKLPKESLGGLVIKIKDQLKLSDEDKAYFDSADIKLAGEAKSIDLDTKKISDRINKIQEEIHNLQNSLASKKNHVKELEDSMAALGQELRSQDILLANKKASHATLEEQYNKIKEEQDLIMLELSDVEKELLTGEDKISGLKSSQAALENTHKQKEENILSEQNSVTSNSSLKEEALVFIAQTKAEIEALNRRFSSDEATLKMLEDTCRQDQESVRNIERQIQEAKAKKDSCAAEIKTLGEEISAAQENSANQKNMLTELQDKYRLASDGASDVVAKIEQDRKALDTLKNRLYELQMQNKDIDFKFLSIKDRLLQSYKVDLETLQVSSEQLDPNALMQEIETLKQKLDSYGNVNLVAIE